MIAIEQDQLEGFQKPPYISELRQTIQNVVDGLSEGGGIFQPETNPRCMVNMKADGHMEIGISRINGHTQFESINLADGKELLKVREAGYVFEFVRSSQELETVGGRLAADYLETVDQESMLNRAAVVPVVGISQAEIAERKKFLEQRRAKILRTLLIDVGQSRDNRPENIAMIALANTDPDNPAVEYPYYVLLGLSPHANATFPRRGGLPGIFRLTKTKPLAQPTKVFPISSKIAPLFL